MANDLCLDGFKLRESDTSTVDFVMEGPQCQSFSTTQYTHKIGEDCHCLLFHRNTNWRK